MKSTLPLSLSSYFLFYLLPPSSSLLPIHDWLFTSHLSLSLIMSDPTNNINHILAAMEQLQLKNDNLQEALRRRGQPSIIINEHATRQAGPSPKISPKPIIHIKLFKSPGATIEFPDEFEGTRTHFRRFINEIKLIIHLQIWRYSDDSPSWPRGHPSLGSKTYLCFSLLGGWRRRRGLRFFVARKLRRRSCLRFQECRLRIRIEERTLNVRTIVTRNVVLSAWTFQQHPNMYPAKVLPGTSSQTTFRTFGNYVPGKKWKITTNINKIIILALIK